jgi:hypothetical protein
MAELAFVFHWPPSEMDAMTVDELQAWHDQASRLMERTHGSR